MKNEILRKYIEDMNFEEVNANFIKIEQIEKLESKKGIVCPTNTTDLWISRNLSVIDVIGIPTVMESTSEYMILDSFGVLIWSGDAAEIVGYIQGFIEEKEL
ncbi:hypothetical protein P4K23_28115 [Bacillus cereus]|uniref:hypothetical protein n=1 Tax=Bacillus toyonensis TaxID=155322 RepID=UPI000BFDE8F0|nr:hypothetical protein [Bacillus toyonensis]MEB9857255.1 hypothetical protein [Bacillus cereus]MEB9891870.1 hypothetical protein [Bacillus cereus]PHA86240.1 hypothetical protein COE77_17915 [Bacillus toyonensis]